MAELNSWGVDTGWHDTQGVWRHAEQPTLDAVAAALGYDGSAPPGTGDANPVWVVTSGETVDGGAHWELILEDGTLLSGSNALPLDLPLGYHKLRLLGEREVLLINSPSRCHLPEDLRTWLWAVQIYALRSKDSWGIGDFADLRKLGEWARERGAGMVMVNPLHAPLAVLPQQDSPYSPSSRIWRNPLYLRVEDVPGALELGETLQQASKAGADLSKGRLVNRDEVWLAKFAALELIFEISGRDESFLAWRRARGQSLQRYAVFCVLTEKFGRPWLAWEEGLRSPHSDAVAKFAHENEDRVRYHAWLQWAIELQINTASSTVPLLLDLAVGSDPDGADAWSWQDCFASGARVGAPPDAFNIQGQDWGLVPFHPWKLRLAGFEPYIEALRANLRTGGGLRIDHVMGLWRQWWVPLGSPATAGVYVRYPAKEMLDILALESVRSQAVIVGEDLGTVEEGVGAEMEFRKILSSKVALFENEPPESWPTRALGSFSTHDLPTLPGVLGREDFEAQLEAGMQPDSQATEGIRDKVLNLVGTENPAEAVSVFGSRIGASPCVLVSMTLEDAAGVAERPNMPGTTHEWPNWRFALPAPLEEILADESVTRVAEEVTAARTRPLP